MRVPALLLTLSLVAVGLAGCTGDAVPDMTPEEALAAKAPTFLGEVLVDDSHRGGEPSILVDHENHYYMSAPAGLVTSVINPLYAPQAILELGPQNRQSFIWRSEDQGANWRLLSLTPPPLPPIRSDIAQGVIGGGDTELAVDPCNTVYYSDLWLANIAISHSDDGGKTWTGTAVTGQQTPLDRQWLETSDVCGEVWIGYQTFTNELRIVHSTDKGMTWPDQILISTDYGGPGPGPILFDEVHQMLYFIVSTSGTPGVKVFASGDRGLTWEEHLVAGAEATVMNIFPVLTADDAGNLYAAWSTHQGGSYNVYVSVSTDAAQTWSEPVAVSGPEDVGTEVFPWITAGIEGHVAVVWYGNDETVEATDDVEGDWFVYLAATETAHEGGPWVVRQASDKPNHHGEICTRGTDCTLPTVEDGAVAPGGNRNLADFFEVAIDREGMAVIAYADDYETAKDTVSRPMFVRQDGGMPFIHD